MANKYIGLSTSGTDQEVEFATVSGGVADAGKGVGLNAQGLLDQSMMPVGSGYDVKVLLAFEAIGVGKFVNIFNDAGVVKVRLASAASPAKPADGFALQAAAIGANCTVYFEGSNNALSALTPGSDYFLSHTIAGDATTVVPTGTGAIVQKLGKSTSATEIHFEKHPHVVRA